MALLLLPEPWGQAMTCAHCGAPDAPHTWDIRPCAIGENMVFDLCGLCDLKLNRMALEFMRVEDAEARLAEYAGTQ
jgi:hypothetical protein